MTLDVVSRTDWEALPPAGTIEAMNHPVEHVVYTHNLDTDKCATDEECAAIVRNLQKKHIEEGAPDIHYNFLIGGNGKAYEGRGWWFQPDKSLKYSEHNGDRVDIAFIGNYGTFNDVPLELQCTAWRLEQAGVDFLYMSDGRTVDGGFDYDAPPSEDEH